MIRSQSKVPAPAKAGVGHFMWLRSRHNVLLPAVMLLSTGALTVHVRRSAPRVGVAEAREAPAGYARSVGAAAAHQVRATPIAAAGLAYRDGAPLGFSGGFGEDHCQACHSSEKLNASPGSLTIAAPERYAAGKTYEISITLTRPGMAIGGFQLTARFEDDSAQAGTLALPAGEQDRMKIVSDRGVQYAYHVRGGTALTSKDVARWTLRWIAPPGDRTVVFHAAANAANADESQFGDFIYTSRAQTRGR